MNTFENKKELPPLSLFAFCSAPQAPRFKLQTRRPFTLVELLAALAVLSIMMLVLMRFTAAANDAWTKSAGNMRVYQNARAVMDLVDQDLKGLILSAEPGAEIHLYDHAGTDGNFLTFVSAVGEDADYASELVEVTYRWVSGTNILKRAEVGDTADDAWNFMGAPAGWESNQKTTAPTRTFDSFFETVTTGVKSFDMKVYPSAASPEVVTVSLTLVDERANVALADKTERTFFKTIYLNR